MPSYLGKIIHTEELQLTGWVISPRQPHIPVKLELLHQGKVQKSMLANLHSSYLETSGIGDGHYAFAFDLPEDALASQYSARIAGTEYILNETLQHFSDVDNLFEGHVDDIEQGMLRGWAWNPQLPHQRVMLDIAIDGIVKAQISADQFRHDLKMQGKGDGQHAFQWRIPADLHDAQSHRVEIRISNLGTELHGSPLYLTCPQLPLPSHLLRKAEEISHAYQTQMEALKKLSEGARSFEGLVTRQNRKHQEYQEWIARNDRITEADEEQIRQQIRGWRERPLISILMPVFNTRPQYLKQALDSVIAQLYPEWELCIADDASTDPHICEILENYALRDKRIRITYRQKNGHISEATNTALKMAKGDYVAFLDNDDQLAPHALYLMAEKILHSAPVLLYSDEDKIDERGMRFEPHFKPDWNYTMLLAHNYICHLMVVRRDAVIKRKGLRSGFNGSQDYDLVLRLAETLNPEQVAHLPYVLYHWRAHADSTAQSAETKPYAHEAGIRAVREHLKQVGRKGEVSAGLHQTVRVKWQLPAKLPKVSIIIPTRDKPELLARCIASITRLTRYENLEILVVDNQSVEKKTLSLFKEISKDKRVRILSHNKAFNYSAINNAAVRKAKGDLICLMNNDIEIMHGQWLEEMVGQLMQKRVGAVGAKLLYADGRVQHAGVVLGIQGVAGHAHKYLGQNDYGYFSRLHITQEYSAVTAACMLIRKSSFLKVGGLNEKQLQVAFNDVDFCLKLRERGEKIIWTPHAYMIHHESVTRGAEDLPEKQVRAAREIAYMKQCWSEQLALDPYYNPNLSLNTEQFDLAEISRAKRFWKLEVTKRSQSKRIRAVHS